MNPKCHPYNFTKDKTGITLLEGFPRANRLEKSENLFSKQKKKDDVGHCHQHEYTCVQPSSKPSCTIVCTI